MSAALVPSQGNASGMVRIFLRKSAAKMEETSGCPSHKLVRSEKQRQSEAGSCLQIRGQRGRTRKVRSEGDNYDEMKQVGMLGLHCLRCFSELAKTAKPNRQTVLATKSKITYLELRLSIISDLLS